MFKKLIIVNHSMFQTPTSSFEEELILSLKAKRILAKQAEKIRSFLERGEKVIVLYSPEEYLRKSAHILGKVINASVIENPHPGTWSALGGQYREVLLPYLENQAKTFNATVIIFVTNRRGITDFGRFIQSKVKKFYYSFFAFAKRQGHVYFVETDGEHINVKPSKIKAG